MRPARRRQKCRPCRQNAPHAIHKQKRAETTTTWRLVSPLTRCRNVKGESIAERSARELQREREHTSVGVQAHSASAKSAAIHMDVTLAR